MEVAKCLNELYRNQPITIVLTTVVLGVIVAKWLVDMWKDRTMPPGPFCVPFIGYLPVTWEKNLPKAFHRIRLKYGPVFSLKIGMLRTIVINDMDALKEAGRKDEFANRPPGFYHWSNDISHMSLMNGQEWKDHRKFLMSTIRNVGMSSLKVEESIREQIAEIVELFEKKSGKGDVNIRDILSPAVNNVMLSLVCGKTFDHNSEKTKLVNQFLFQVANYFQRIALFYFFPSLRKIVLILSSSLRKLRKDILNFQSIITGEIEEHKTNGTDEKADYMDHYLNESQKRTGFSENILLGNSLILIQAGSETVRTSIEWCLLCLAQFQIIQDLVYKEIIAVLGSDKEPEWKDREQLVLVQAFILEVMRWKSVTVFSDPHWTSDDVQLNGFLIPKNTFVLINLWSIHNDRDYWGDPENFRPERFLSNDFKSIVKSDRVIPFSIGKRNCPGEKLGEVELFIFVTSMIQKFRFLPPETGVVCMDEVHNLTRMVVSPFLRVESR